MSNFGSWGTWGLGRGIIITLYEIMRHITGILPNFGLFGTSRSLTDSPRIHKAAFVVGKLEEKMRFLTNRHESTVELLKNVKSGKREEKKVKNENDQDQEEEGVSAYYHFNSIGKKYYNKWDHFDVDEEERRVDQQSEGEMNEEEMRLRKGAMRKELRKFHEDLVEIINYIDDKVVSSPNPNDKGTKRERRELIERIENMNDFVQDWSDLLSSKSNSSNHHNSSSSLIKSPSQSNKNQQQDEEDEQEDEEEEKSDNSTIEMRNDPIS